MSEKEKKYLAIVLIMSVGILAPYPFTSFVAILGCLVVAEI